MGVPDSYMLRGTSGRVGHKSILAHGVRRVLLMVRGTDGIRARMRGEWMGALHVVWAAMTAWVVGPCGVLRESGNCPHQYRIYQ